MHALLQSLRDEHAFDPQTLPSHSEWQQLLDLFNRLLEECHTEKCKQIETLLEHFPDMLLHINHQGMILQTLAPGTNCPEKIPFASSHTLRSFLPSASVTSILNVFSYSKRRAVSLPIQGPSGGPCEARVIPIPGTDTAAPSALLSIRNIDASPYATPHSDVIKKIFEKATEGIAIHFLHEDRVEVNKSFCHMLKLSCDNGLQWNLKKFRRHLDSTTARTISQNLQKSGRFQGEAILTRDDGSGLLVWINIDTIYDTITHKPTHRVAMITDISQIQATRQKLHFSATRDPLTKLPNRSLLMDVLRRAVLQHQKQNLTGALLFIDLDNFKIINDQAGHAAGDRALIASANRIMRHIRPGDTFGRLGGDEFLLILEDIHNKESAGYIARRILHAFEEPFTIDDQIFELGASIGIVLFPRQGSDSSDLIHRADLAMYQAKKEGKNRFHYYTHTLEEPARQDDYTIEQALRTALNSNGFHLLYQPMFDARSDRIIGAEALLRLRDQDLPAHNQPKVFIPIAERLGLSLQIGQWVFNEVCRQLADWNRQGLVTDDLTIAVNLSRRQLTDETWYDYVSTTLDHYDLKPENIDFEITETALMVPHESSYDTIQKLQKAGFRISLDDFGTGYSALSNLKHISTGKLKIDRSLVEGMIEDTSDQTFVNATVALGHAMDLRVTAEGVETDQQRQKLLDMGCDELQGFLLGHPVTPECLLDTLQTA